jgi:membrane protein YdbS with pleckstrin-like domain
MIQLNTKTKLPNAFLGYRLVGIAILSVIICVILVIVSKVGTIHGTVNGTPTDFNTSSMSPLIIFGIPILLFVIVAVYNILYYLIFSFSVDSGSISVTSGVIFISTKTVDFKTIQNVSTGLGPILYLFGLKQLNAYTSSPGQISIVEGKGGATTVYKPDISIPLLSADAEQLRVMMAQNSEVQKVEVVK